MTYVVKRFALVAAIVMSTTVVACGKDSTGPDNGGGVEIPTPVVLGQLGSALVNDRYTAEVAASGNVAYTTTWGSRPKAGNITYVWNVSGNTPVLADSLIVSDAQTIGDVQISPDGKYLVVATERTNGSIVVYDRTDPLHPVFVSRFLNAHTTNGVHTMKMASIGGKLYGFLQIDPPNARLTIVEMTDPTKITEVYSQIMGSPYIHDVFVRDGYLFAALWNDGMTIFDVGGHNGGTPSAPVQLGGVMTETGQIHNIWWFHDPVTGSKKYAFLGEEGPSVLGVRASGDIHVVDVSNFGNPKEVAIFSVAGAGTHNFWVDEQSGILYAAYYNGGVRAIDVRGDLSTCTATQKAINGLCNLTAMGRQLGVGLTSGFYIWGVQGVGNRLFASDMQSGLLVLDISALKR